MTQTEYNEQYEAYRVIAQQSLLENSAWALPENSEVCRAARYSLLGGGKRIRAVLVLAVCDMLHGDTAAAADLAAAVEMLHCYSLIHDDLPCMDNDDYRRGKPSCHKAYGEATALLAGDVLLTEAFQVAANAGKHTGDAALVLRAVRALGAGAGSAGMVYGQELDLQYEALSPSEEQLRTVHRYKTGALINAAIQMGAACAGCDAESTAFLESYAYDLGLVFQIIDDVLDETSTSAELGKPVGSDAANGKVTYATLYGVDGAKELAAQIHKKSCDALKDHFGDDAAFLIAVAENLLIRTK